MKTKPSKFINVLQLILAYSVSCTEENIILNQLTFASFLDISHRTVARHFSKAKELGYIKIIGSVRIYNKHTKNNWLSNIYEVNNEKINEYIKSEVGADLLNDIDNLINLYHEYMNFIKNPTNLEDKLIIDKKSQNKIDILKKENVYYIKLLDKVNNNVIPLKYLNQDKKRLVSNLCSTRNQSHDPNNTRIKILKNYFKTESDIIEYDTNASIYRLSYALGHGYCAPLDMDMYEVIFKECNFDLEWNDELRSIFKKILMPIYMRESSLKYRCLQYNSQKSWKYIFNKTDREQYNSYIWLEERLQRPIWNILDTIRNSMHKVLGLNKFYKADIFIYESNLHILMLKLLKDLNVQTLNVYDGFYFVKGTLSREEYNEIYTKASNILLSQLK